MAGTRTVHGHPGRTSLIDRVGNCETVDHLKNVVRDILQVVSLRGDVEDGAGKTQIKLDKNLPMQGSPIIPRVIAMPTTSGAAVNPSTDASGAISQDLPQLSPTVSGTAVPQVQMCIRAFNNYQFTTGSTLLNSVAYAPRIPSQELHVTVNVGGKTMYGRIPLMDNPDEGVPKPLIGYSGNALTTDLKCDALLQMHNDLVQSLLKYGVLRPVERLSSDRLVYTLPS